MKDDNKTLIAKDWILKLANGINPLDCTAIPEGDIVNNVHVSRCLFYVADLIDSIYAVEQMKKRGLKGYEQEFNISVEDLAKVVICEKTGISNFTREINKFTPQGMKPLAYVTILNWLLNNGYLETVEIENFGIKKRPTAQGVAIGITAGPRERESGTYWSVEYNANAQRFILSNLHAIIEA